MKLYVGITDRDWYHTLITYAGLEEVNFWQPGGQRRFAALAPGELFLFKLHHPLTGRRARPCRPLPMLEG